MPSQMSVVVDEYPHTRAILSRVITSPGLELDLPVIRPVRDAFAGMVRRQEFDVCEMALATYIQARDSGSPITLLPVTMLARFQHPNLLHRIAAGLRGPSDLAGRRVGIQSYAQTTGVWMRGVLSRQYGVRPDQVEWVSLEPTHVEGFTPPPNVSLAAEGSTMAGLLESQAVDAAIVSRPLTGVEGVAPLIGDVESATREWYDRTGAVQVNHVMCVTTESLKRRPDAVAAVLELFARARAGEAVPGLGLAWAESLDPLPAGCAALTPILELALELCAEQRLVSSQLALPDLIADSMLGLAP